MKKDPLTCMFLNWPQADDFIGECLLMAIKEVLGDAATDEIMEAWTAAYGFLANAFITLEQEITEKMTLRAGYSGFVVCASKPLFPKQLLQI